MEVTDYAHHLAASGRVQIEHHPRRARQAAVDLCQQEPGRWFEQRLASTGERQLWGDANGVHYTFTGDRVASGGTETWVYAPSTPSPAASLGAV